MSTEPSMMTSAPRVLTDGLLFPEGPVCLPGGDIAVCELAGRRVSRITPSGRRSVVADFPGSPNGQVVDRDGALLVCDNGGRWVAEEHAGLEDGPGDRPGLLWRLTLEGERTPLLQEIDGSRLTSPNDLCFGPDGSLWFTDPVWPGPDGVVTAGRIGCRSASGAVAWVHEGLLYPNGLGVTPDGSALIVAESYTSWLHRFPILGPGRLGEPERFAHLGEGTLPDGLCFDLEGRIVVAGAGTGCVVVFSAEGAELGRIPFGNDVTNLCFGGPDRQTVYVTEAGFGRVSTMGWDVPGLPVPYQPGADGAAR